jgi:hypothetical protein
MFHLIAIAIFKPLWLPYVTILQSNANYNTFVLLRTQCYKWSGTNVVKMCQSWRYF